MKNFCLRRKIRPALQGLANQQHGQMPNNACYQWAIIQRCKKVKVAQYSIAESKVPELILVLGSQPAGDMSHKPGGRLPLLFASPEVSLATIKRAATNFAAW